MQCNVVRRPDLLALKILFLQVKLDICRAAGTKLRIQGD